MEPSIKSYLTPNQHSYWQWLRSELSERMAQNLPYIHLTPRQILLLGGHQKGTEQFFLKTYPDVHLWTDANNRQGLLNQINPFRQNRVHSLVSSNKKMPRELDLIWAGPLTLGLNQYADFFQESGSFIKNQGLMMFNYLGPDTAKEWRDVRQHAGWIGPDMHDLGDILLRSGFGDPVMNMEYITLEYDSYDLISKDLQGMGLSYPSDGVAQKRNSSAKLQLTLEVVYGHAWKVEGRKPKIATISPKDIGKSYKKQG